MEARIARIESDVAHLNSDVGEIKLDLRALRDKVDTIDARLTDKIDGLATVTQRIDSATMHLAERADRHEPKIDLLRDDTAALRSEIASAKYWGLAFGMTLSGVMLTVMARGFGWL
jgi:outer membrane murein-binding lipoprotein Lpp